MDINQTELIQAGRVFGGQTRLQFIAGDIRSGILEEAMFDVIVFAASVQYFPSLQKMLNAALAHLTEGGEIHILDTPLYGRSEVEAARQRTATYYSSLGFPAMADYYFHHSIDELKPFEYAVMHKRLSFSDKILGRSNPFPWICVKRMEI